MSTKQLEQFVPKHIRDALSLRRADREEWILEIMRDFDVLRAHNTFTDITSERPAGTVFSMKQIFLYKKLVGEYHDLLKLPKECRKARTVTDGARGVEGRHYTDKWAPVTRPDVIKILIALAVQLGLVLSQADCENAFYGSEMDIEGVKVKLPAGYNPLSSTLRDLNAPPLFATLVRGVPGIKQGSALFHNRFKGAIKLLGYLPSEVDPCLFVRAKDSSFVALWVDDFVTAMKTSADMAALVRGLAPELTINKWGPLKEALGMTFTVEYNAAFRSVFVAQGALARLVVQRAGLEDANPARSPGEPGFVWSREDCPKTDEQQAGGVGSAGILQGALRLNSGGDQLHHVSHAVGQ